MSCLPYPKPYSTFFRRRRRLLGALAAAPLAGLAGGHAAAVPVLPARLRLDGPRMLDPSGRPVTLRGVNEGTWGLMRSYDAATIASCGANVVRVLLRWWGAYIPGVESRDDPQPGHFEPQHLRDFLTQVQWCVDAGHWVVAAIDSNCGQDGLQDAATVAYCDPKGRYPGGHNFWTDPSQQAMFRQAWVYLAQQLEAVPNIAFYELLPEPLAGHDASWAPAVSSFYQDLMAAIEDEAGDTRTPFLVGARNAYDIELCDEAWIDAPRWRDRVVYTGDLFLRTGGTQQQNLDDIDTRLGALVSMRDARGVPVFIQQFGVRTGDDPDEFYLDAGLSRMNAAGVGYTGWQWRQNTPDPDEFGIVLTDAMGNDVPKQAVLSVYSNYWRGAGTGA